MEPRILTVLDRTSLTVSNVDELVKFDEIQEGITIQTLGYHTPNDGGAGIYEIRKSSLPEDKGSVHNLSDGFQAHLLITDNTINIKDFGAKGDGVADDTLAFMSATQIISEGDTLLVPSGTYLITEAINIKNKERFTIKVDGVIKQTKHGYCGLEIESCKSVNVTGNGKIEGYGSYPVRSFNPDGSENSEKSRAGGGFATNRRNGTEATTPFGGGWEGTPGYGILIFEGSENVQVTNIEISGFNYSAIGIGWTNSTAYNKNISVSDCTLHHCQDNGVAICRTYGVTVDSNTIYNIGHPSATIDDTHITNGYGITLLYWNYIGENVIISNNNIRSCTRKGIDAHACKNGLLITNNLIEDCYVYGIALPNNSPTSPWSEFTVSNNVVRNSGVVPNYLESKDLSCGIFADVTLGATITGNSVYDSGRYGIYVYYKKYTQTKRCAVVVSGNSVVQNNSTAKTGIQVYSDYEDSYLTLANNTVQSDRTSPGVYVGYLKSALVTGNLVRANMSPNTGSVGMKLINVKDGTVTSNDCSGEIALSVQGTERVLVSNSNICNGTYFVNSSIKEIVQNAYFIQKNSSGTWTITNRYNPVIEGTLTVTGNVFKLSFPKEFKVQADVGFMNGPLGTSQIATIAFNNSGDNFIEVICYDKTLAQVTPANVTNGTGFTLSLKFLWRSL
ncbi:hypothetical protein CEW46_26740 [Bacillus cereus]|nr:hypothetical protein CEW46_26740 [Bacillus cereus]